MPLQQSCWSVLNVVVMGMVWCMVWAWYGHGMGHGMGMVWGMVWAWYGAGMGNGMGHSLTCIQQSHCGHDIAIARHRLYKLIVQ